MESILFILYPAYSHVVSVSFFARSLSIRGYQIVFAGNFDKITQSYILSQGFSINDSPTIPFGLSFHDTLNSYERLGLSIKNLFEDAFQDKIFESREAYFEQAINEIKPKIIFLDTYISSDVICLYNNIKTLDISLCMINTHGMFQEFGLPTANSLLFPDQKILILLEFIRNFISKDFNDIFRLIFSFGMFSQKRIIKKATKVGLEKRYISRNYPFNLRFQNLKEIVLSHREWDFPKDHSSNLIFCGFQPNMLRQETISESEYIDLLRVINTHQKIIYISFGLTNKPSESLIKTFIEKINLVSASLDEYAIVIGPTTNQIREYFKNKNRSNIFLFGLVPQILLLSKASLFITHGGFNSIKEALYFKVPMLVIPLNMNFDQPGNSTRIVYHKLGLRSSFKDSPEKILRNIKLILNSQEIKLNLEKFKSIESSLDLMAMLSDNNIA